MDDYDNLSEGFASKILQAVNNAAGADRVGLRFLLAGNNERGLDVVPEILRLRYVHARTGLLDRILSWSKDPRSEPVILVRGRPGSGKTELLRAAIQRFANDPGPRLAWYALSDPRIHSKFRIEDLVRGVAMALQEDGLLLGNGPVEPEIRSEIAIKELHAGATAIGIRVNSMQIERSLLNLGELRALLQRRADHGRAHRPLVIVIDALNELRENDYKVYQEIRCPESGQKGLQMTRWMR